MLLRSGVQIHIIGIGGIGMSAIARVLRGRGFLVSGSDRATSDLTASLAAEGIAVFAGHRPHNLSALAGGQVLVVASSAIAQDNPELVEARRLGFPVLRRREFLGELTAGKTTLAVAGAHGKTTATAMIAWILVEAGLEPTFIVGGLMQNLRTNAQAGAGPHFVIEADEYDRTFLGLQPAVAVITALEHDHPDCYPTFADMRQAFAVFAGRAIAHGALIVCGDDPEAHSLGAELAGLTGQAVDHGIAGRLTTYGAGPGWDWSAEDVSLGGSPTFTVRHHGKRLGTCAIQLPGRHNVLNALAALAAAAEAGVDFGVAAAALTRFRGTARRFEVKGHAAGITVVDDYAHHPTEIRATLEAARLKYPGRVIWAVFQPHTFSRTAAMLEGFAAALCGADRVLVLPIYAAREVDTLGVSGADLASHIMSSGRVGVALRNPLPAEATEHPCDAQYVDSLDGAVDILIARAQSGDIVLTMGAGDGYLVGDRMLARLGAEARPSTEPAGAKWQANEHST